MARPNTLDDLKEIKLEDKYLVDYLIDDEQYIDPEKRDKKELFLNISKNKDLVIYDLGPFWHDPSVNETTYINGVDLARVMGCLVFGRGYFLLDDYQALEGDDYFRIFLHSIKEFSIEKFVMYEFKLLNGNVYISKGDLNVHVSGRQAKDEAEWKEYVEKYFN